MDNDNTNLEAIEASLMAVRAILIDAVEDVDHGLAAARQRQQNAAVGSVVPTGHLLTEAATLIQAIFILHRQQ
jgi:hypothetical protein